MNQIRPEVAALLAEYVANHASKFGVSETLRKMNPCWYWLDWNAEHGASKEVIEWMLRDAERYEELAKR